jgi:hypothetical protein
MVAAEPGIALEEAPVPIQVLAPGERVRVSTRSRAVATKGGLVGRLLAADEQALTIAPEQGGPSLRVERSDLARLEVSRGQGPDLRPLGALAGAAAGFAVGLLACVSNDLCDSAAPLWIATGLGVGLGAVVSPSGERWRPVQVGGLRVGVTPTRGGAAVSVGVRF